MIFNQYSLQVHFIEEGEINMFYFNFGVQFFRETAGSLKN